MASESLRASRKLASECPRSSVSRAYYAAYAAVTQALPRTTTFPQNRNNPSHEQLPALVTVLGSLDRRNRRNVRQALSRLRNQREDADYRPRVGIDLAVAKDAVRDASLVLSILGMESE